MVLWVAAAGLAPAADKADPKRYQKDVEYLLDEIEKRAGHFFKAKGVDWGAVRKEFTREVRKVKDDVAHVRLCDRLLARARDGHAAIIKLGFEFPQDQAPPGRKGIGLSLALVDDKVIVKDCFGPAAAAGVKAGFEVTAIEGGPPRRWLQTRQELLADSRGFSTDAAALYAACHEGLADVPGTAWAFKFKSRDGNKSVTLTCGSGGGNGVASGPVFPPADLAEIGRQRYGKTAAGFGYIHLRDIPDDLPRQLDQMLGAIGDVPGLILDCRANGGGGTDHAAVFSRFLASGAQLGKWAAVDEGEHFAGALVVLIDAGVRSAGETVVGMLKESGRARVLGPTPTAGMSGSKEEIEVPSGLLTVRIVVRSYQAGSGAGPDIEGHGVAPTEVCPYDAGLLADGVDPLIRRAEELLRKG